MSQIQDSSSKPENIIQCEDFDPARLRALNPDQKTIPGTGPEAKPPSPPQYYYQVPLLYDFGKEDSYLDDVIIEGCELTSEYGIQSKPGMNGKGLEYSIMAKLDLKDPKQAAFAKTMDDVFDAVTSILLQNKSNLKFHNYMGTNRMLAEATGQRHMVHYYKDLNNQRDASRSPSMFFKLFCYGKAPLQNKTKFTGLDEMEIPWELLYNSKVSFIPLVHIKHLYVGGGKAIIKHVSLSAIVTFLKARNEGTRQSATISRLNAARPDLRETVARQVAKITTDRQDSMISALSPGVNQLQIEAPDENKVEESTVSGLSSTRLALPAASEQSFVPYNGSMVQSGSPKNDESSSQGSRIPIIPTVPRIINKTTN